MQIQQLSFGWWNDSRLFSSSGADGTKRSLELSALGPFRSIERRDWGRGVAPSSFKELPPLAVRKTPPKQARFGLGRADFEPRPPAERTPPLPLCLLRFTIWFGFFRGNEVVGGRGSFPPLRFWLFRVSLVSPGQSVSSSNNKNLEAKFSQYFFFFPNHLIKISSTTTKKIRSSCSK